MIHYPGLWLFVLVEGEHKQLWLLSRAGSLAEHYLPSYISDNKLQICLKKDYCFPATKDNVYQFISLGIYLKNAIICNHSSDSPLGPTTLIKNKMRGYDPW